MTIRSAAGAAEGYGEARFSLIGANPFVIDGEFDPIATVTVGLGGAQSITFSNIPGTYQHLQIRGILRSTVAAAQTNLLLKINGSNLERTHRMESNGASVSANSETNSVITRIAAANATASVFSGFILDVVDYASTTKNKVVRGLSGNDRNGTGLVEMISGVLVSTSPVTSLTLEEPDTAQKLVQNSILALYGVRL